MSARLTRNIACALLAAALACTPARADEAQDLFDRGVALQNATNAMGARAVFEVLIDQFARSERATAAHYQLAQLLASTNPVAAAVHYAAVAGVENHPLAEPAAFGRAEALYRASDWKGAADAYGALLARYPAGRYALPALYSRGWALFQAGTYEGALQDFRNFAQKYPTNALAAECQLKAGDALRQLGRGDDALQAYDQARAAGPRLAPEALAGKAWVLYGRRDFAAAQAAFREAAQACGREPRAAPHLFNAGNAALEAKEPAAAAELFGQVQQEWPAHELARAAIYWQAVALLRLGKADEAASKLALLRQVGVPAPLAADTALLLAQAQDARHRYAEAAALYASVVTNFPGLAVAEAAAAGSAVALEKAGKLPEAETAALAYLQQFPAGEQRIAMQFLVGEYRYRQGKYAEAAPEFERFAATNTTHELAAAALHKAAWCRWNLRQPERARELFGAVLASYGRSPQALDATFMQARAAEACGDPAAAAAGYEAAVRLGRDNETAQRAAVELIRLDHAAKRHEAALRKADAFLASHATGAVLPLARLYRAEALLELNRLPEALEAYRQVGDSDPAAAAGAAYGCSWVLRRQNRHAEAAESFGRVAAGNSTYAADAQFWAARSLEDEGRLDAASAAYGVCLRQTPPNAHADEAAYRQAYCLWQTRKPDDAERLYSAVLRDRTASPFAANALYDLAWVMLEQGKKGEARQRFEEFTRLFPKHLLAPDAHFRSGELAFEKEDYTAAAASYETAAAAQVAFRDKALYKLGWTREKLRQRDAAIETFLRLAQLFPRSEYAAEARYRAGLLLQEAGKFDDARAAFAAVGDSVLAEKAALAVADCWRAAGRPSEAAAAYGHVLEKWPQGESRAAALAGRAAARRAGGQFAEAAADYAEAAKLGGESLDAARATLGQAHCWFALRKWEEAARAFAKVDVIFAFDELKPEALAMAAKSWEQAGDAEKAALYRAERKKRFPKAPETAVP
jgi:TolA-binding protein